LINTRSLFVSLSSIISKVSPLSNSKFIKDSFSRLKIFLSFLNSLDISVLDIFDKYSKALKSELLPLPFSP